MLVGVEVEAVVATALKRDVASDEVLLAWLIAGVGVGAGELNGAGSKDEVRRVLCGISLRRACLDWSRLGGWASTLEFKRSSSFYKVCMVQKSL